MLRKCFLQVKVVEEDLDPLRFFWRGQDDQDEISDYLKLSHLFGKKGSSCIAN